MGKRVTEQQARQFAVTYSHANKWKSTTIQKIAAVGEAYYIINFTPQGWIIISGDDTATPILGYSEQGSLDFENLPENMQYMLDEYADQIQKVARIVATPHLGWSHVNDVRTRASGQK